MKKIIFTFLLFLSFKVYAIENISINSEALIPYYSSEIHIYNYYSLEDSIKIVITSSKGEKVNGYGVFNLSEGENIFKVSSSIDGDYIIRVYKNYKNETSEAKLKSLIVEGYELNYNEGIYEYYIDLTNQINLNIDYELYNYLDNVVISGNGNFNKNDNIITIKVSNLNYNNTYTIHCMKTIKVNSVISKNMKEKKINKNAIIISISIASSTIIFFCFYILFIKKLI